MDVSIQGSRKQSFETRLAIVIWIGIGGMCVDPAPDGGANRQRYHVNQSRECMDEIKRQVSALGLCSGGLDSVVLGRGPKHLGPPVPIDGDARASHDRWTSLGDGEGP